MKTKHTILILLTIALSTGVQAQTLTEKELTGTWKVTKIDVAKGQLEGADASAVELLKSAFLKAKFVFKADKNFDFDFEFKEMSAKNAHWEYNPSTRTITIQEWKDKDSDKGALMQLLVKKEGDKITFLIVETPFTLEVKKE